MTCLSTHNSLPNISTRERHSECRYEGDPCREPAFTSAMNDNDKERGDPKNAAYKNANPRASTAHHDPAPSSSSPTTHTKARKHHTSPHSPATQSHNTTHSTTAPQITSYELPQITDPPQKMSKHFTPRPSTKQQPHNTHKGMEAPHHHTQHRQPLTAAQPQITNCELL